MQTESANRLWQLFRVLVASLALCVVAATANAATLDEQAASHLGSVPVTHPDSALPTDWHRGAFMEIFVRAYQDSNGDGIGDLRGITQRLDYLQSLGVKGIWLMPINPSQDGDHGYAVNDYRMIEPAYGDLKDFDELIAQAHSRGIGVIMDYVVNHSAAKHPVFLASAASAESAYRDWYVWQNTAPAGWNIFGSQPWRTMPSGAYLAQFSPTMPDFNFANPKVKEFHLDNMRFWLNRGVDGFRFDAVTHLIENGPDAWYDQAESYTVMGELHKTIQAEYRNRYYVCEATKNAEKYASPDVCGRAFALGYQYQILQAARGKRGAIKKVTTYFNTAGPEMATMLSNHDLFAGARVWDQFKGDQAQYRLAAATYLLLPGTPFIYYGEEMGMAGNNKLQGDPSLRIPMSWSADNNTGFSPAKPFRAWSDNATTQNVELQLNDSNSLLNYYKSVLSLRNDYPALLKGDYKPLFVDPDVLAFQRTSGTQTALVLIYYGTKKKTLTLKNLPADTKFSSIYPTKNLRLSGKEKTAVSILLLPQSVNVFNSEKP